MRLLQQQEADLVCGMDFHVDVREGWDRHWRNIPAAEILPYGPHGPQLGVRPVLWLSLVLMSIPSPAEALVAGQPAARCLSMMLGSGFM